MKSFESDTLTNLPLTHNIVRSVGILHEFKGREQLNEQQVPQALDTLRQTAIIQSTESSNRIEGVTAAPQRIKDLVNERTTPKNRSEQEITGYRDVLATIHADHEHVPFSVNVVLQFHRDLFKYTNTEGGRWKPTDNAIIEKHPDGTEIVRFQTVAAYQTPDHMVRLHERFHGLWTRGEIDKLMLIPSYVLDFLCIHPFLDGNGRMARLLTLLLLYKAGYGVGRYISLEKLVEETRESYYDALAKSSRGWHEGAHTLEPWTEYFLGIMMAAYRSFEDRVGMLTARRGAKTQMILDAVERLPDGFRTADVERLCPGVSRAWIRRIFDGLKKEGVIWADGYGAGAVWRKRQRLNSDTTTPE